MKAMVIGYGSIGSRHERLLTELGCDVTVVSKRDIDYSSSFKNISDALIVHQPSYVVVANKTSEHYSTLVELVELNYDGIVLVEKPLFHVYREVPKNNFKSISVAYNLRFHPIIKKLKSILENEKVLSAQIYAGQYLPQWRPHTDYRLSYSASNIEGGGVLRDLSHEIDYINWIFCGWECLVAFGGHYSHLDIKTDDIFSIMLRMKKCPIVNLHLNYLDRVSRRNILINTDDHTIEADLINNTIQINQEISKVNIDQDFTYYMQHQEILNGNLNTICSIREAMEVMRIVRAAEQSVEQKRWVYCDE